MPLPCSFSRCQETLISCLKGIQESKKTDAALLVGAVALLSIGVAASCGGLNFIGTTNSTYLSYGMYSGAGLFFGAELVHVTLRSCKTKQSKDDLGDDLDTTTPLWTLPLRASYVAPDDGTERLSEKNVEAFKKAWKADAERNVEASYKIRFKDEMEKFSDIYVQQAMQQDVERICHFLFQIVDNEQFQKNPPAYLKAWENCSELPEMAAYRFLEIKIVSLYPDAFKA